MPLPVWSQTNDEYEEEEYEEDENENEVNVNVEDIEADVHFNEGWDRVRLEREAGDRMGIAYTKYCAAASGLRTEIQDEARKQTALVMVLLKIGLVPVTYGASVAAEPIIAFLFNILSPSTSNAQLAQISERAAMTLNTLFFQNVVVQKFEEKMRDCPSYGLQGDVVNLMCEHYSHILQSYRRDMSEMSTEQLLVLCAAFDSTRATTRGYKKTLERLLDDHALIMSCNRRQLNGEKRAVGEVVSPDGSKRVAVYGYSLFNKDQLPWMWSLTRVGRSGKNGIRLTDFAEARPRSMKFVLRFLDDEMVQGLARVSPRWKDKVLTEYKMVEGCQWTPAPGAAAELVPFQEYSLIVER